MRSRSPRRRTGSRPCRTGTGRRRGEGGGGGANVQLDVRDAGGRCVDHPGAGLCAAVGHGAPRGSLCFCCGSVDSGRRLSRSRGEERRSRGPTRCNLQVCGWEGWWVGGCRYAWMRPPWGDAKKAVIVHWPFCLADRGLVGSIRWSVVGVRALLACVGHLTGAASAGARTRRALRVLYCHQSIL